MIKGDLGVTKGGEGEEMVRMRGENGDIGKGNGGDGEEKSDSRGVRGGNRESVG